MAQNGRRFHVLANRRPKSVAVFTIWRAEGPNRSSFSRFGEQKTQIGRRFHVLASRRPKSVVVFTFWRAERPNRSSFSRFGEQKAQIGRRFHVLANKTPKSVLVFTFWRTEGPNRSLISCFGKQTAQISRRSCLKAAKAAQNAPDKRTKATWIHWDRDLRSWPTPLETLIPPEVRINGQKALAKPRTTSPSSLKSSQRR